VLKDKLLGDTVISPVSAEDILTVTAAVG